MKKPAENPVIFLERLFFVVGKRKTCIDPEKHLLTSVQSAVSYLKKSLDDIGVKNTRDWLAHRCGVIPSHFIQLEIRGRPARESTMKRLCNISRGLRLWNLAEFFESEALRATHRSKPLRKSYGAYRGE